MAKRKKRNQKLDLQELWERNSKHECKYCEQQQVCNAHNIEHVRPKMYGGGYPQDTSSKVLGNNAAHQSSTEAHEAGHRAIKWATGSGKQYNLKDLLFTIARLDKRHQNSELPKPAEYLAYLLLPKTDREILLGDLTEEYPAIVAKFGRRGARFYFYKQVIWSIWPLVRKALIKWGAFGWVVELIRKIGS